MKVQLPSNTIISNMCVSDSIRNRQHVSVETKMKVRFKLLSEIVCLSSVLRICGSKFFSIDLANCWKINDVNHENEKG